MAGDGTAGTNARRRQAGNQVRDKAHTWGTGDDNHAQSPPPSYPRRSPDHLPGLHPPQRFTSRINSLQSFLLSSSFPLFPSNMHVHPIKHWAGARSLQDPVALRGRCQPGDKAPKAMGMPCSRGRLLAGPMAEAEQREEEQKIWEAKYFTWVAVQRAVKSLMNTAILSRYCTGSKPPSCCCWWVWVASQCSAGWV